MGFWNAVLGLMSRMRPSHWAFLVLVVPAAIKKFFRALSWIFKILYFCLGWLLPARIRGDSIRFREMGIEGWLYFPILYVFGNRYGVGTCNWIISKLGLSKAVNYVFGDLNNFVYDNANSLYQVCYDSIPSKIMEPVSVVISHITDMNCFIPLLFLLTVIKLVQIPTFKNLSDTTLILILLGGLVFGFNLGIFDSILGKFWILYEADKNLAITWVLVAWFIPVQLFAIIFQTKDLYPCQGLVVSATEDRVLHCNNTRVFAEVQNWFRYFLLLGGVDIVAEARDVDKGMKSFDELRNNFGLGIALAFFKLFFVTLPRAKREVGQSATRRETFLGIRLVKKPASLEPISTPQTPPTDLRKSSAGSTSAPATKEATTAPIEENPEAQTVTTAQAAVAKEVVVNDPTPPSKGIFRTIWERSDYKKLWESFRKKLRR